MPQLEMTDVQYVSTEAPLPLADATLQRATPFEHESTVAARLSAGIVQCQTTTIESVVFVEGGHREQL